MSDTTPQRTTLSTGQLARRWGISRERIVALIRAGRLHAFRVPSAGRFGECVRVPLAAVEDAEREWALLPARAVPKPPPAGQKLRHLRLPSEQSS